MQTGTEINYWDNQQWGSVKNKLYDWSISACIYSNHVTLFLIISSRVRTQSSILNKCSKTCWFRRSFVDIFTVLWFSTWLNLPNDLRFSHALNFSIAFLKIFWWESAFIKKLENINSNDFRMIFALSTNVCMRKSYVIVQQYFKKFCKNYVCLRDMTNLADMFERL